MPVKKCKDCNYEVGLDRTSGKWWCSKCKEVKEEFDEKYRIVVLGKNTGRDRGTNNFAKCIAREWKLMGHEVIEVNRDILSECTPDYDMENCIRFKKPIDIKLIQYRHDPDFMFIEQLYEKMDISNVTCPVIYQHREYTHFPDIDKPDILLGSYPGRVHIFEQYNPWNYHQIKYRDTNYVAVYPPFFPPVENKILIGIYYMGWSLDPARFIASNGLIAKMVIEDQVNFMNECINKGYVHYVKGELGPAHYRDMVGKMEAIIIDGGHINGFGRTMFEAMLKKTLCIVRVHNELHRENYKQMGLTKEMCYFIDNVDDLEILTEDWDDEDYAKDRAKKVEKAYDWVMENHTYEVRAKETLEKFEAWKRGEIKTPYFMGYSKRMDISIKDGVVELG